MNRNRYIVGVDEAGRGPLAGPVSVAAVAIPEHLYISILRDFRKVKDSKKVSPQGRVEWLSRITEHHSSKIFWSVSLVGNSVIDSRGIVRAVRAGVKRSLQKLDLNPRASKVLLDGSLFAPREFISQRTIIRGDEKEKIIAMASIIAKVHRDRHMERKAKEYPKYGFEIHKGYGTRLHISKIKKHGLSDIHRRSFTKNLIK